MTKLEKAHQVLNSTVEGLEVTLGWENNRETTHEGRNLFRFECMFCDDNNVTTVKNFEVSLGNGFVKEL